MAIRAAAHEASSEDILFENTKVSLCLLLNRHARTLRIFDFRAGADPTKRGYVFSIAQREGVERVYTVVERDEIGAWQRLGFQREGVIPGFFKRSDAYVLGGLVPPALGGDAEPISAELEAVEPTAEKTLTQARKVAREIGPSSGKGVRVQPASDAVVKKTVAQAVKAGKALSQFDRFGRDVERAEYLLSARGGFSLLASVERQPCFDNAFIELLTSPRTDRDVVFGAAGLRLLCEKLKKEGTVGSFATSPIDDVGLAAVWLVNGFRRTGTLIGHQIVRGRRGSSFLWTRKLSLPDDHEGF
jgi:hypothetical protein